MDMSAATNRLEECGGSTFPSTFLTPYLRFADFHLDLRKQVLTKNGLQMRFVGNMYSVLTALLENPGEIVTRESLRAQLWPGKMPLDCNSNINTTVNQLRHALGDLGGVPTLIETVPRRGYRLVARVECVDCPATISSPKNKSRLEEGARNSAFWNVVGIARSSVWLAAGGIALVVGAMLFGAAITLYLHRPL
jgi:DNA-binding winged helix-turn-helix (wHTH) protein